MRKKYSLFIISLISVLSSLAHAQVTKVTFTDVTKAVSERNYTVLTEAEKSYQAKLNVEQARNNLLPKLNIWSLAKVVIDPLALLDVIPDIAPFLVPSNWFRLRETEILFYAEKEGYRALWANELSATHTIYLRILMDHELYQIVSAHRGDLKNLYEIAQSRWAVGLEKIETVNALEIQLLKLEDDESQLKLLIEEELLALSFSLGYPANQAIEITPVALTKPSSQSVIDYKLYVLKALDVAPEIRQFDNFLKVIPWLKKEANFSFLGGSETSRGVAGGVFDNISISNGLGFSTATSIKIIDSQKKVLDLQRTGVLETIKRQLQNVVNSYNTAVNYYAKTEKREALAISTIESLSLKLLLGEKVDLMLLADAYETRTLSKAAKLEQLYRFRLNQDRLQRLIFDDEYKMLPATLVELKK